MRQLALAAFAAAIVTSPQAFALEPFKVYDTFGDPAISPARWFDTERIRSIKAGVLQLAQRSYGLNTSDVGSTFSNWNDSLTNAIAVTALRAKIMVNAVEVSACPTNTALGQSRARISGTFFNVGTPTPGSQVGDALAQVRITRFSNSADPAGVMRVQGILSICTTADCNAAATVGNIVDLGTVSVGQAATVQLQWDKPAKTFLFSRDGGAFSGSVAYADSDASPPSSVFKQVSTRLDLPSCMSAPRVAGYIDASFDNVLVNASAAP
jgi:hypothetical protein